MKLFQTLLLSLVVLTGCHGAGAGGDLTGFWTVTMPDGRQVTEIKVEKEGDTYQIIGIPPMRGRCILNGAPYAAHLADKDKLADLQVKGLKEALIGSGAGTLLVGPSGDWSVGSYHATSGYVILHAGVNGEIRRTDGCFDLEGKPVQQ